MNNLKNLPMLKYLPLLNYNQISNMSVLACRLSFYENHFQKNRSYTTRHQSADDPIIHLDISMNQIQKISNLFLAKQKPSNKNKSGVYTVQYLPVDKNEDPLNVNYDIKFYDMQDSKSGNKQ